ncbi:MAG: hypothetical protein ACOCRK_12000 [bacterium]
MNDSFNDGFEEFDEEECYDKAYSRKKHFDGYYTDPEDNPNADEYEITNDEYIERMAF